MITLVGEAQMRLVPYSIHVAIFHILFTLALVFLVVSASSAQMRDEELPSSGTLSGTYTGGNEGVTVPGVWGKDNDVLSNDQPPITGSVSQINRQLWKMRIFNNSEDDYSVSVKVNQFDKRKKKIKSDTYSYTLRAGENKVRDVRAKSNTDTASLELLHWKNLSKRKKDRVVEVK